MTGKSPNGAAAVTILAAAQAQARAQVTEVVTESIRRRRWLDKLNGYEMRVEATPSTTRQVEALNIGIASPPTSPEALIIGKDVLTGNTVFGDPMELYRRKVVNGINTVILGDVGHGKSSYIKCCHVARPLVLADTYVVVIDQKPGQFDDGQTGGEYTALSSELRDDMGPGFASRVAFRTDGTGSRVNIYDRRLTANPIKHAALVQVVAEHASGGEVRGLPGAALRIANKAVPRIAEVDLRPEGDIRDLVTALRFPAAEDAARLGISLARLRRAGADLAADLERLIEGDLAGIMDGPTSDDVRLDARFTVFDVSDLPENGPALSIAMLIIQDIVRSEIAAAFKRGEKRLTYYNAEEGWTLLDGPPARMQRRNWKYSRGLAMANLAALHHVADVKEGSDGEAVLKEAEFVLIFRQKTLDDAQRCVKYWNLPEGSEQMLMSLPPGHFLYKVGSADPILVEHIRSPWEMMMTNTDSAIDHDKQRSA